MSCPIPHAPSVRVHQARTAFAETPPGQGHRPRENWKNIPIIINSAKELTLEEKGRLQGDVVTILKKGDVTCGELLQAIRMVAVQAKNGKS